MRVLFSSLLIASAMLALTGAPALALGVTPLVLEINSGDPAKRVAQILVSNDSDKDVPIEVVVSRAEISEDGGRQLTPAASDFLIFPPSRMLRPHSKQVFRVQWAGAPLNKSQTYILSVNQLPVAMPEKKSGFQIVFNFDVVANVAPATGQKALDVLSSSIASEDGKRYVSLFLGNSGTVHAKLSEASVMLRAGNWSKTLSQGELEHAVGIGIVQPGKKRRFKLPVQLPADARSVSAEVFLEKIMR
ncbi:fimbrial biogenesis chaperone [Rhodomicrobium lacus]|uniref:fimbrial biogenesis chaperone n=1 Tax=Rhodomicrobium lacus TaxID=2498452 RepID=UPI000F8C413B|nr:fimbria/pilus periplasmic chaperone [Rhodomicrobium lacus]